MQLTTDQKAEIRDDKWKQLINMIARRVQDPKTGNPHPPQRVENALEEAGFHVNWDSELEEEFDDAIDVLRPIIPVSLDEKLWPCVYRLIMQEKHMIEFNRSQT